jgi:hypothetical protein
VNLREDVPQKSLSPPFLAFDAVTSFRSGGYRPIPGSMVSSGV